MRQIDEGDTDTLTLQDRLDPLGMLLPQTPGEAYWTLYPYLPTWRTPLNLVKGVVGSVLLALPILAFLGTLAFVALLAYGYLGPVAGLSFLVVGGAFGHELMSNYIDKLWRIDDEAIRKVNSRN